MLSVEIIISIGYTGGDRFQIAQFSDLVAQQELLELAGFDGGINRHKFSNQKGAN